MTSFDFSPLSDLNIESCFIKVPTIASKSSLMQWYSDNLYFPYFGYNWDSLFDCLKDLSWIPEKTISIYHNTLPELPADDLKIYLEILHDTIKHWKIYPDHLFRVIFHPSLRDKISSLTGT